MQDAPKFPYCWVEGDRLPALEATYLDQDLTTFTSVRLHLSRKDGTVLVKDATAIDFSQGHFKFEWDVGDLLAGFNQEAEIEFVDAAGLPITTRLILIDVRGQLA